MLTEPATLVKQPSRLARFAQSHPLIVFFVLAYLWTWSIFFGMLRFVPEGKLPPLLEVFLEGLFTLAIFGPTVAAVITNWLAYRNLKICRLWTSWRSLLGGLALGLGAFFSRDDRASECGNGESEFVGMALVCSFALEHVPGQPLDFFRRARE
jgi:hypothetical protein